MKESNETKTRIGQALRVNEALSEDIKRDREVTEKVLQM